MAAVVIHGARVCIAYTTMIVSSLSGFSTGNSRGEMVQGMVKDNGSGNSRGEMVQGIVEEKWYRE